MERQEIDSLVKVYYKNKQFVEKYKTTGEKRIDVAFKIEQNKNIKKKFPAIDSAKYLKKINR